MSEETKKLKVHYLGQIQLGKEVVVSDPCYSVPTWCQAILKDVKPGTYNVEWYEAFEDRWDGHMLVVSHVSVPKSVFPETTMTDVTLGIDSGQVGIYDSLYYKDDEIMERFEAEGIDYFDMIEPKEWYGYACTLYEAKLLLDTGVTSPSGYGDGTAELLVSFNNDGDIVRIGVNF